MRSQILFATAVAALFAATSAQASVEISAKPTKHMTCSAGVCAPTSKNAVLNATDLANMLAAGDVKVTTGSGAVTITVSGPFSWTSSHRLTLDANLNISFRAPVEVAGTGAVTIVTNDGGTGGDLLFFPGGSLDFWDLSSSLTVNGKTFTLVGDIATLASDIGANASGSYALAKTYDASVDGTYTASPVLTSFSGAFDGLGHSIENLSIHATTPFDPFGLFNDVASGGMLRNISLEKFSIVSNDGGGASLAGQVEAGATIERAFASGTMSTGSGLVYWNTGTIADSATNVTITDGIFDGGLVHSNNGTIVRSHASGPVTEIASGGGGLAGMSSGVIEDSYATGNLISPAGDGFGLSNAIAGGLVGQLHLGTVLRSFATGSVTVKGDENRRAPRRNQNYSMVGGLVGWNEGSTISDSYATGNVTFAPAPHTKQSRVGGLVGQADGQVSNTYSSGLVRARQARKGGVAGIASTSGIFTNSYWDFDTSQIDDPAQGAGRPSNEPGITGLTDAQLRSGLPTSFDPAIWAQSASINNGYPYLLANPPQ
jgi:hypothetical protein